MDTQDKISNVCELWFDSDKGELETGTRVRLFDETGQKTKCECLAAAQLNQEAATELVQSEHAAIDNRTAAALRSVVGKNPLKRLTAERSQIATSEVIAST